MAVKIRLKRRGRKKLSLYDVVVADARAPRDGRFIEKIGTYNPNQNPAGVELSEEKALSWLLKGAQPTDTVRAMLSYRGVLFKKHLQIGVQKEALSQEEADKRYVEWQKQKESSVASKVERLRKEKEKIQKERLAAEEEVSKKRATKQAAALTPAKEEAKKAETKSDTTKKTSTDEEAKEKTTSTTDTSTDTTQTNALQAKEKRHSCQGRSQES